MSRRPFLIVLIAFVLSVMVRTPHLGRPLGAHHEYCTAVALIILQNWHTDGFFTHKGNPIVSFTTSADRYPPGFAEGPAVHDGLIYYFSHPPLAYDLPYLLFQATGSAPNVLGLELFNVFFHLIAAWFLFRAVRELLPDKAPTTTPLFAAVVYLFMPAPLWFHGNAYMSDMFVQNFWVMHLALALRLFIRGIPNNGSLLYGFTATLFLAVYTSWLGVFAAVAAVGVAIFQWRIRRDKRWLNVAMLAVVAVVLALGITVWRYTRVVDLNTLMAFFRSRFEVRGSVGLEEGIWPHLKQITTNYRMGYLPILLLLGILVVQHLVRSNTFRPGISRPLVLFVSLAGLPVLMDHVFLLQYADHDFTVLKAGPLLCGITALGLARWPIGWGRAAALITCVAGVLYYYRINPLPGSDGADQQGQQNMGLLIAAEARPDEAVFTLDFTPEPQVQWYAKRTLFRIDGLPQATALLRAQGVHSGVVFMRTDDGLSHQRISVP